MTGEAGPLPAYLRHDLEAALFENAFNHTEVSDRTCIHQGIPECALIE